MSNTTTQSSPIPSQPWHLNRSVPISLIAATVVQALALAFYAGQSSVRLDQVERKTESAGAQGERIVRLETKMDALTAGVGKIESKIELLLQRK